METKKRTRKQIEDSAQATSSGLLLGGGAGYLTASALKLRDTPARVHEYLQAGSGQLSAGKKINRSLRKAMNVSRRVERSNFEPIGRGPAFGANNDGSGVVAVSPTRKASILAHEYGHASGHGAKSLVARHRVAGVASAVSIPGLIYSKPGSNTEKASAVGAGLIAAESLGEEARASIRGYKGLKSIGVGKKELSTARRTLGRAFMTYVRYHVPMTAGIIGGALAGKRLLNGKDGKEN